MYRKYSEISYIYTFLYAMHTADIRTHRTAEEEFRPEGSMSRVRRDIPSSGDTEDMEQPSRERLFNLESRMSTGMAESSRRVQSRQRRSSCGSCCTWRRPAVVMRVQHHRFSPRRPRKPVSLKEITSPYIK